MIKKWQLTHVPTARDSLRHKLSLDCDMKDVFFLMKKLGASCSRPEKEEGDFSYSVYLLKADSSVLEKAKQIVEGMSEKTQTISPVKEEEKTAEPIITKPAEEKKTPDLINQDNLVKETKEEGQKKDEPLRKEEKPSKEANFVEPKNIPASADIGSDTEEKLSIKNTQAEPANEEHRSAPEIKSEKKESVNKPQAPKPPVPNFSSLPEIDLNSLGSSPQSIEEKKSPEPEIAKPQPLSNSAPNPTIKTPPKHSPVPSSSPPSFAPPSVSLRTKKEEPKKEEEKKQEEPKKEIPKEVSARTKSKWPIELPLNPTLSFQTLIAGPHNRFAHAAAMAVVENPGVMYNPLLIFGPQGIGKSHFIHAIGYGLSSSIGQKNIFVTHAVKFSKGIEMAIEQNTMESLENMLKEIKVIIIDDIDLFMVTEKNRPYISRILNECVDTNKQIIVSSMFPPKSLAPLEESLGFQFTQGWMVDIKVPNTQTYRLILNQMLSAIDLKISEDDIKTLFISKMADFRSVSKILAYSKKMEKYLSSLDPSLIHKDFISMLLGINGDDETFPTDDEVSSAQVDLSAKNQWFKWGIFYPKGFKKHADYALANLKFFASSELKIDLVWEHVFFEEYDPDEIYGIPFKVGETASSQNVNGVIVLGPQSTSALGAKEQEFKNLTEKILESFSLKAAWLDSSKLKAKSNYLRALMELL
ncbi:MAG: ATP-binding protein [Elusimicrobia bacterium]|nr:ATP-binding protein [Elusimicrobiota bacterium]